MQDVIAKELIENFNKDFRTNIDSSKYRFLEDLYDNYICLNSSNDSETETVIELGLLDDEITEFLNKKQLEMFNKFDKLKDELLSINNKHAFIYGFCVSEIIHQITNATS